MPKLEIADGSSTVPLAIADASLTAPSMSSGEQPAQRLGQFSVLEILGCSIPESQRGGRILRHVASQHVKMIKTVILQAFEFYQGKMELKLASLSLLMSMALMSNLQSVRDLAILGL